MSDTAKFGTQMILMFLKWFIPIALLGALLVFLGIQLVKMIPNIVLIPALIILALCCPCIFKSIHQRVVEFMD